MLNIEGSRFENFEESGAGVVGLYRTESLFIRQTLSPMRRRSIEYAAVVRAAGGQPVTMRSLIWGDKLLSKDTETRIALMGFRAIRLCLEQPELLKFSCAILRASALGPVN